MQNSVKTSDGSTIYLFDIANRLRKDKDVKESLAIAIDGGDKQQPQVVAHLVLEEGAQMDYTLLKYRDTRMT